MQFGFRAKRSCVHAITSVTDYNRGNGQKSSGHACFLGLKKTFDSLDHTVTVEQTALVRI